MSEKTKATPTPVRKKQGGEEKKPEKLTFKEKCFLLQQRMAEVATSVVFDGVIQSIGYEYADTQQYKKWLAHNCNELGLLFELDVETTFPTIVSPPEARTPVYGVQCTGVVTIADVDSDASRQYRISGFGANVQVGYCASVAQTNALRNFITNNWLLDNRGREGDDVAMNGGEVAQQGYVSPSEKARIKQGIAEAKSDEKQYATDLFARALYAKVQEARRYQSTFGEKILAEYYEADGTPKLGDNGKTLLPKNLAVAGMARAEEIVAAGAKGGK